jgi:hypothetical protein
VSLEAAGPGSEGATAHEVESATRTQRFGHPSAAEGEAPDRSPHDQQSGYDFLDEKVVNQLGQVDHIIDPMHNHAGRLNPIPEPPKSMEFSQSIDVRDDAG